MAQRQRGDTRVQVALLGKLTKNGILDKKSKKYKKFVCKSVKFTPKINFLIFSHLFSDLIGRETTSMNIITSLIKQQDTENIIFTSLDNKNTQNSHYFIFPPLSKLILKLSVEEIIKKIKVTRENPQIKQFFIWITPKNIEHPFISSFVMHLADTIVEFIDNSQLILYQKKSRGTIQKRNFNYKFDKQKIFEITEIHKSSDTTQKSQKSPAPNPEQLSTFKIGDFSAEELKAKSELEMSYEK